MRSRAYVTSQNIERKGEAWLASLRRRVRPRPNLRLNPSRCALLVIDLVHYFASPRGRAYLPATKAILPNVGRLVDAWHRRGGAVVFTRHAHEGPHDLGMLGKFFSDYIHFGEPEAELVDALQPVAESDLVLRKTTYDAFAGTGLETHLRLTGCDQVLVTGVLTQMCCETTARSAFVLGFETFVAADATATTGERHHLASLAGMASCVAVVLGTREILDMCAD